MRTKKLLSVAIVATAFIVLSAGAAVAGPPEGTGNDSAIATKHDHAGSFTGNYTTYDWGSFSGSATEWTFRVHAKEAVDGFASSGTVQLRGQNPDGSTVKVVGHVEYAEVDYPYWTSISGRTDVLLLAGWTKYQGQTYDFMYLESENTVWLALNDSQTWESRVAVDGVFETRDFQIHSTPDAFMFDLAEKQIR